VVAVRLRLFFKFIYVQYCIIFVFYLLERRVAFATVLVLVKLTKHSGFVAVALRLR